MLRIGLKTQGPSLGATNCGIDTNLLQGTFSVAEYLRKYIFRRQGVRMATSEVCGSQLFPKICESEIFALNNSIRGLAKVCAADDFEFPFYGENAQMEYLEDHGAAQFQNPYHDQINVFSERDFLANPVLNMGRHSHGHGPENLHGFDAAGANPNGSFSGTDEYSLSNLYSSNDSQSLMGTMQHPLIAREAGIKPQFPFVQIQNVGFPKLLYADDYTGDNFYGASYSNQNNGHNHVASFSARTAADALPHPLFSDLKHPLISDTFSCDLSVDSFDSPLDEMFVKSTLVGHQVDSVPRSASRKRKHKTAPGLCSTPATGSEVDLPCSYKVETFKKLKREPLDSVRPKLTPKITCKDDPDAPRFVCPHCDAAFRVRSYLTRHLRKHTNANAFVCPFFQDEEGEEDFACSGKVSAKCHPTGGFSRKDTFKTHLKALHFIYPPRTRSKERPTLGGRCAGCFEYFDTNSIWFKEHIEPKVCPGLLNKGIESTIKQEMD